MMENMPEKVLNEYNWARLNEEAVNIEKVYFYKTDKRVNPRQEEPFLLTRGELPVLVSAPHAVRHYRQKKILVSDQFTGSVVFLLNKLTGCHAIAATKLYGGDPNADDPCLYKDRIASFCREKKVKVVLDIHGAARERDFDVDLGTNQKKNLLGKANILEILEQNFRDFGLARVSTDFFAASGANTVSHFVSHELGIPAVQIEINKHYRVPAQNALGFHRLMGALAESVKRLA
ncbi:hypothetical protein UNSWDHB_702 [Dehalobacter sp. UNSWDHB]|jgi:hypothetical protein|uniref:hypothetical protein n=1 Tax=unclassified Dehalobacter TaxID=2635733 RepID=UPI00028BAFAA|nr:MULTISPECIES: hypothetical protein [unclassified Dehalobacter]AFV01608.1 hypothetical protein DHBDCA_p579 [Dehalobacter sp. DCA]AFV04644.1 hypothetical protein DCF50_p637 [Dehalobacter sp. CF]EQB21958.1 hypothetical protein UNSWDHB_702 [Dehalobacter sp. UNSWDHB]